jgi:membrane associated rhomboid family serine protease
MAGGDTNVAWEAHVGGFLFGVLVGLVGRSRLQTHSTAADNRVPIGRIYRSS